MKRGLILAAALALFTPGRVQASIILFDSFDSENAGAGAVNYNAFSNFTVTDGTVDLVPMSWGQFDFLPGNGLYVDLDGSTYDAGVLTSGSFALGPGDYSLSFDLAGSQRPDGMNTVTVLVFGGLNPAYGSATIDIASDTPFTNFTIPFVVPVGDNVQFYFANAGEDRMGALLDDVQLEGVRVPQVESVPEPGTLLLFGLAGLGLSARRLRTRRAGPAH